MRCPDHLRARNKSGKRLDAVDAVLQSHHPCLRSDQGDDGRTSLLTVEELYGEDHNIDSANIRGPFGSPDIAKVEGTAGDESDVFTGRGESCTDIAADAA